MTSPMTPGQARVVLDAAEGTTDYTWSDAHHALETIANMRVQEDWRLVSTEQNGGLYEKKRWTRMISEWVPDE